MGQAASSEQKCEMSWILAFSAMTYAVHGWIWWIVKMVKLGGISKGFARVEVDLRGEAPKWWMVHFRSLGLDTWGWMPVDGCTWSFWVRKTQLRWARYLATTERPPVAWDASRGAKGWEKMVAAMFGWSFGRTARGRARKVRSISNSQRRPKR